MRRFKPQREFFIPKGAVKVTCKTADAVVYLYDLKDPACIKLNKRVPCARLFIGKAAKPAWSYRFANAADRERKITESFAGLTARAEYKAKVRAERKAFTHSYKVGDIFKCSWGYDQTNVNYYQVIETKGKSVTVREIAQKSIDTQDMSGYTTPLPGAFLEKAQPKRCMARDGLIKIDSYRWASFVKPEIVGGIPVYPTTYQSSYA